MPRSARTLKSVSAAAVLLIGGIAMFGSISESSASLRPSACTRPLCRPGVLPAGVYTTTNFAPGLKVTVPAGGWSSSEDSTGEFNLHPPGHAEDASLFVWLDPHPITYTDAVVSGVTRTPAGIVAWLRHNKNVVVSNQTARTIGQGIKALSIDLNVPRTAKKSEPQCPTPCVDYFLFRGAGFSFTYGTGYREPVRLYLARIGNGATSHTLTISIDTPSPAVFKSLNAAATKVLASLRLPKTLPPGPR